MLSWVWNFSHTDSKSSGAIQTSSVPIVIDTCSRALWIGPLAHLEEKLKIYVDRGLFKALYNDWKSAFYLTMLDSKLFCPALSPVIWPAGLTVQHSMLRQLLPVFPFFLHLFSPFLRTSYIDSPIFVPPPKFMVSSLVMYICTYNLLSPFSIVNMYTHSGLTT